MFLKVFCIFLAEIVSDFETAIFFYLNNALKKTPHPMISQMRQNSIL
jgi:hypothetical protein